MSHHNLARFIKHQDDMTPVEILESGRTSPLHTIRLFPSLFRPDIGIFSALYRLTSLDQAIKYLEIPALKYKIVRACESLLKREEEDARDIFRKYTADVHSCMTLFSLADHAEPVYRKVMDKYFGGDLHPETVHQIILKMRKNEKKSPHRNKSL